MCCWLSFVGGGRWESISCVPNGLRDTVLAHDSLFSILLPLCPKFWDYRCAPPSWLPVLASPLTQDMTLLFSCLSYSKLTFGARTLIMLFSTHSNVCQIFSISLLFLSFPSVVSPSLLTEVTSPLENVSFRHSQCSCIWTVAVFNTCAIILFTDWYLSCWLAS